MSHPSSTNALGFDQFGDPSAVITLRDIPVPVAGPDEITIEMILCPINPSDINYIEGKYGLKPVLPAIAGLEGVGRICVAGENARKHYQPGQFVRLHAGVGGWRRFLTVRPDQIEIFPGGLSPEQAAVFSVNPLTAWCLLTFFRKLDPGQWVIQNAATSAVGKYVIQIAKHLGLHTVNLVRNLEVADSLKALGADVVVEDQDGSDEQITALTGKATIKLGLNAVGGDSALRVCSALGNSAAMVTYGAMSKQSLKVPNGFLIFKNLELRGFWLTQWKKLTPRDQQTAVEEKIAGLFKSGVLYTFIESIYPPEEYKKALSQAQTSGRKGKILFRFSE